MYFTFGIETTYNSRVEPSYVMDMSREQLLFNKSYKNIRQFNKSFPVERVEQNYDIVGQVGLELTFDNEGWGRVFEVLLGKRIRANNLRFQTHQNGLRLLLGKLGSGISTTATSFSLDENTIGELDGTNTLLIGDELITGAVTSSGSVTGAQRGTGGTTAVAHFADDLAYCLESDASRSIDICSPDLVDERAVFTKSMSVYVKRPNAYFCYTGIRIDRMEFNFTPGDIVESNITFAGADSTNLTPISPITTYDDGNLIAKVYVTSLLEELDLRRLYLSLNNTLVKDLYGFDKIRQDLPVSQQTSYGQIAFLLDSLQDYQDYINNTKHNLSIQMIDWSTKPFEKAIILNNNDMRINTFSPQYTDGFVIQASAPFYTYKGSQIYVQY